MTLVLASTSASRQAMLEAAGVAFEALAPGVDEAALKAAMAGARPRDLVAALAVAKATRGSLMRPGRVALGSDSLLVLEDGTLLDKPGSAAGVRRQLVRLRGRRHRLLSAAATALDGARLWQHVDEATLRVREFTDSWLDAYVEAEGEAVAASVGAYHLEGRGVQLFEAVEGDHFTVRGMPLIAVLAWLRTAGLIAA